MLTAIIAVTMTVPDLAAVERAYGDYLGYRVVDRGQLAADLAEAWGAPALAGREFLLMQPESGAPVYLRVIRQEAVEGFAAMRTHGWNSNEILVEDTYAVHERLKDSPFRIIGEPKGLSMNPEIIAMQALGPAEELVYLTRIPPGKSLFNLGSAQSFVDRTFIVVLGGPDMEAMRRFYSERLGMPVTAAMDSKITVLAKAWDLPVEQDFKLAIVQFPASFLIELDEYPPAATPRPQRPGELPPGMSMVSFSVESLDGLDLEFLAPPRPIAVAPYNGRRTAVMRGAAGEYIELVEGAVPAR
jgi:catechol 2,3-dioxygenase-like lactoylglutathione lyase family enzyme